MSSRQSNKQKKSRVSMISTRRVNTSNRFVSKSKSKVMKDRFVYERCELDSRADTCCAGATAYVIEYTGKVCDVYPYSPKYKPRSNIPIVKAVTA
jgi:hypothetical protein